VITRIGSKPYKKYQVVIPKHVLKEAGWIQGEDEEEVTWQGEITFRANGNGRIMLARSDSRVTETSKLDYDAFRRLVHQHLSAENHGLTYAEIRAREPNLPRSPAAIWVKQLEADIGLVRIPNANRKILKKIWKLQRREMTSGSDNVSLPTSS
jgi:bifunctional DNA-binding transcriptional regulator/antitoxin component of YhaV-PrlF toxin-antitoxin module